MAQHGEVKKHHERGNKKKKRKGEEEPSMKRSARQSEGRAQRKDPGDIGPGFQRRIQS